MRIYLRSLVFIVCLASIGRADLIHRYSFNNGESSAIDSVGGQNGTLEGGATISGNAVQLNGTGAYVNLPAGLLIGLTSVTFEAWFTYTDNGSWVRVFDFGETNSSAGGYYVFYTPQSGADTSRFVISNTTPGNKYEEIVNSSVPVLTVPVYIACVYNGSNSTMSLYVNGELASSISVTIPLSSVHNVLSYLDRSLYNADPYLKGSIDEFRIYDNVLISEEIHSSYEFGPDSPYASFAATNPKPANDSISVLPSAQLS